MKKDDHNKFIKTYTKETFFYHILNQALRRLHNPLDSFYIRQPFQDLFLAVLQLYQKQKNHAFREKNFPCYRGCIISNDEFNKFVQNKGGFVEMEGFLSTSLEKDQALSNYECREKNTIVEVNVKVDQLGGELDWGFADITESSNFSSEK